jgi:hypothetical protein
MTTARQLDKDLVDHACSQLAKVARKRVREGMGPASAASAAIRETKALFPPDWRLAVQGDDSEETVEVWEVEHKRTFPCASVSSATKPVSRARRRSPKSSHAPQHPRRDAGPLRRGVALTVLNYTPVPA